MAADPHDTAGSPVLEVSDLTVDFETEHGWTTVVDSVSFSIEAGETLGLVGESGSGKTITALSVMGLVDGRGARVQGSVKVEGREMIGASEPVLRTVRGDLVSMIFQEPRRSLNPAFTVGNQIAETVRRHQGLSRRDAWAKTVEMLDIVGIPDPARRARQYPHELSGGMCQRVMLGIALACEPALLIADEPTTALDATVQKRMLGLMQSLKQRFGLSILFISHDLGVVSEMADRVAVMYAGSIAEIAPRHELFAEPGHPYTAGLLATYADGGDGGGSGDTVRQPRRMLSIAGMVPAAHEWPTGCRFHPRCLHAQEGRCDAGELALVGFGPQRASRCVRRGELVLEGLQSP